MKDLNIIFPLASSKLWGSGACRATDDPHLCQTAGFSVPHFLNTPVCMWQSTNRVKPEGACRAFLPHSLFVGLVRDSVQPEAERAQFLQPITLYAKRASPK